MSALSFPGKGILGLPAPGLSFPTPTKITPPSQISLENPKASFEGLPMPAFGGLSMPNSEEKSEKFHGPRLSPKHERDNFKDIINQGIKSK